MTWLMRIVIVQPSRQARLLGFAGRFCATRVIGLHSPVIVVERHLYMLVGERAALSGISKLARGHIDWQGTERVIH